MIPKLYLAKGTAALAPHIMIEELDLEHELVWLDFSKGDQKNADFAAINPKGRVPVLALGKWRLTETGAILNYLAASNPDAGFWPADPFVRARIDELSLYLAATVHVDHAHGRRGARWADDKAAQQSMAAKVTENVAADFAHIESRLASGPWWLGAAYSTADIYLFTVTRWLAGDGVPLAQFPRVAAHFKAMSERPAVQRAVAMHV